VGGKFPGFPPPPTNTTVVFSSQLVLQLRRGHPVDYDAAFGGGGGTAVAPCRCVHGCGCWQPVQSV